MNLLDDELSLQLTPNATPETVADSTGTGDVDVPAWELVEAGRYMPRRIRGSYRGRELG